MLCAQLWQDLSSWNVEFSQVYPQYPLENINRLEREFVQALRWEFFISGSLCVAVSVVPVCALSGL